MPPHIAHICSHTHLRGETWKSCRLRILMHRGPADQFPLASSSETILFIRYQRYAEIHICSVFSYRIREWMDGFEQACNAEWPGIDKKDEWRLYTQQVVDPRPVCLLASLAHSHCCRRPKPSNDSCGWHPCAWPFPRSIHACARSWISSTPFWWRGRRRKGLGGAR